MDILIGFLLPPVVEVVNKDVQNRTERFIIAYIISIIVACVIDWQAITQANLPNLLQTFAIIATESNITFSLYWKESLVRQKLQVKLQTANNPRYNP